MPLNGARKTITYHEFRGVCFTVDPAELPPYLASSAMNVDFSGETFRVRNGRSAYNGTTPVSSRVRGLGAMYHSNGNRYLLMQAGTALYADRNGDGDFADANETLASGLTGGVPCDIWQVRDRIYAGSSADAVRYWDGSATAAVAVAQLTVPATPVLSIRQTVLEDFESEAEWTEVNAPQSGGTAVVASDDEAKFVEGTQSVKMLANAATDEGSYMWRDFAADLDLSLVKELVLWCRGSRAASVFQVGIYRDGETPGTTAVAWDLFPSHVVETAGEWFAVRIPLSPIAPTARDAVPGMAIRYVDDGGGGYGSNVEFWFDDLKARGHLPGDRYTYYLTYYDSANDRESAPSTAAVIDVDIDGTQPVHSVYVATVATNQTGVDKIRIYRRRENGPFSRARVIYEIGNTFGADETKEDNRDEGSLAADPDAFELVDSKEIPPKAATFCVVGKRLLAGNVTPSSTNYPYRIWLSRFGYVEEFRSQDSPTDDPYGAGWIDIPSRAPIRRIIDYNGMAVVFTDREIWTLTGSVWGPGGFSLQKRADVGLDAREAVGISGELVYFLSGDGLRVLAPNFSVSGEFRTWLISEPLGLETITGTDRSEASIGVDRLGRVHLEKGTGAADAFVFDPRTPGALSPGFNLLRPGWTYYLWPQGHGVYLRLRTGAGDEGQLLAGDYATGKIWYIGHSSTGAEISTDDGSAISWVWQSPALMGRPGYRLTPLWTHILKSNVPTEGVYVSMTAQDTTASSNQIQAGGAGASANYVSKGRWPASVLGRRLALSITRDPDSVETVRHTVYEVSVGLQERM